MKRTISIISLFFAFCITASAQANWANYARYEEANKEVAKAPKAVFMGDSITDFWCLNDPEFFDKNNFLGRGISGQVTGQMVLRFRRDVCDHKPKYAVIFGGINDIAQNMGEISLEDTFGNIVTMLQLCRANRIKPVVCLLFPTTSIGWRKELTGISEKVETLNGMISAYAREHNIPVVEYFKDVDRSSGRLPAELSQDSIHPTADGYKIMDAEILKYLK